MTGLEELIQAALLAPAERRSEALRVLRGEAPSVSPAPLPPTPSEPHLTLRELAAQLSVSVCTLWRWKVPGYALGGRQRYRLSEVEAYLTSPKFKRRQAVLRAERRDPVPSPPRKP
ncbi:MAG: helix-turn-helix domain-containing protein [Verrucomicrobiales bacterium]|nr:helix-turn-helix domain-containing protein [Verrucomicrobiales bacterium]